MNGTPCEPASFGIQFVTLFNTLVLRNYFDNIHFTTYPVTFLTVNRADN